MRWNRLHAPIGALISLLMGGCGSTNDDTPPASFETIQVLLRDQQVSAEKVAYQSGDLRVIGEVCRPVAPGHYPIFMINHGGWGGLGSEWTPQVSACVALARLGYFVIEPSYRGEDGSAGVIELCAGEAADVR